MWALILGIGFLFLPETPRYWVSKSEETKAKDSLRRIRNLPVDHPDLVLEYDDIKANFDFESKYATSSWTQVFKTLTNNTTDYSLGLPSKLCNNLLVLISSSTMVLTFKRSGIEDPFLIQLATNIVNVGMTVPGIILVETWGRRPLLMW